jgi:hypothetical protein
VDRLLTRAHGLFPAAAADGGAVVGASSGGAGAPRLPAGASGLGEGTGVAGGLYWQAQSALTGLDAQAGQAAQEAVAIAGQGRIGSGAVRDQARAQAAAMMPLSNTAAGVRLLVSTMDERLAAMQRQLGITTNRNQAVATRLQQVDEGYRMLPGVAGSSGLAHGGQVQAADFKQGPPPPPPTPPAPPPVSAACESAIEQQQQDVIKKFLKDVGKGALVGGGAGVFADGVGVLPGALAGAALGGLGSVIDWATSPNPLPPECK